MGIVAKHEWRRLKAAHRGGQAMVATGWLIILGFAVYLHRSRGAVLPFMILAVCLIVLGWVLAARASRKMAKFPQEDTTRGR